RHLRQICGRTQAREGAEIVDEMCLVEVSTRKRDVDPVRLKPAMHHAHHLLKAAHATEELRRQPDFLAEHLDESPRAHADLVGDSRDRRRCRPLKLLQRKSNGRMTSKTATRLRD